MASRALVWTSLASWARAWWGPVPGRVVQLLWLAAAWIGIQLLVGAIGLGGAEIAVGAHIGGFIAGLALTRPLLRWGRRRA